MSREKKMIAVAGAAIVLFALWQVVVRPVLLATQTYERVVPEKQKTLAELREMSAEYQRLREQIAALKNGAQIAPPEFSPLASIEQVAKQAGEPVSMKPSTSDFGEYQATNVEVKLEGVTMSNLMRFLQQLDASGHPLHTRELTLRQSAGRPGSVDAVLQVRSVQAK